MELHCRSASPSHLWFMILFFCAGCLPLLDRYASHSLPRVNDLASRRKHQIMGKFVTVALSTLIRPLMHAGPDRPSSAKTTSLFRNVDELQMCLDDLYDKCKDSDTTDATERFLKDAINALDYTKEIALAKFLCEAKSICMWSGVLVNNN